MQKQFTRRLRKLKGAIRAQRLSALLVTNMKNIRYLTGFTGSSAHLFVSAKNVLLMSDTRYETQLSSECPGLDVDIRDSTSTLLDSVVRIAKSAKFKSIGFEAESVSKFSFDQLQSKLDGFELISTTGIVEAFRCIKDELEIEAIRRSIALNEKAFQTIQLQLTPDQTERQIAHNLEHQMRAFGATGCAFAPIVGIGPRAALPHGKPGLTQVKNSPFVLIDWGTELDGYLSDLTRMIVTGKPTAKFVKIYETVLKAQLAAIRRIKPGVKASVVDGAARKVISDAGFGKYFGHGLGHSFGLEIHEKPFMSPVEDRILEAGMVLTVEPGIYLPGIAGVRIEDDVLVTEGGHEVISNLPKQLDECTVDLGS